MADEFAVITATVPATTGEVEYTDSAITAWEAAIVITSGDNSDADNGGRVAISYVQNTNTQLVTVGGYLRNGSTPSSTCCFHSNERGAQGIDCSIYIDETGSSHDIRGDFNGIATGSDGFKINWTDVDAVVAGADVRLIIILIGGLTNVLVDSGGSTATAGNFTPDFAISTANNAFTSANIPVAHFGIGVGAVINNAALTQRSVAVTYPNGYATTESHVVSRDSDGSCMIEPHGGSSVRQNAQPITAIGVGGLTEGANSVGPTSVPDTWLMMEFSDTRSGAVANESLSGTTGATSLVGLDKNCEVIFGMITGSTAEDTLQGSSRSYESVCLFATDGTNTYSVSCAHKSEETISASNTTNGYSSFDGSNIKMVNGDGTTTFEASVTGITGVGLDLNITTGFTGSMFLWGITAVEDFQTVETDVHINEAVGEQTFAHVFGRDAIDSATGGAVATDGR